MSDKRLSWKHELVLNNFLQGMTKKDAILKAGYSISYAQCNADNIFEKEEFKRELEKRRKAIMSRNALSEDWIVERLMQIASASLGDIIEIDDRGSPFINWSKMSPELRASIDSFQIDEMSEGRGDSKIDFRRLKVKQRDALRALEMLGKYLGIFKERVTVDLEDDTIKQLYAARARAAERNRSASEEQPSD